MSGVWQWSHLPPNVLEDGETVVPPPISHLMCWKMGKQWSHLTPNVLEDGETVVPSPT